MGETNKFEVIIIGGSYAGLSAAMALGRSLRKVLVIDYGKPCNEQTPHSHNFLTNDGKTPQEISLLSKQQVEKYDTIRLLDGLAIKGKKIQNGFEITTNTDEVFQAKKLVFATGVKDIKPEIGGFSDCWGISVIHCPYCHGYEVRNKKTGILGNGEYGFEFAKMITNWTKDLTLYTNGVSTLTTEQSNLLEKHGVRINEAEIDKLQHKNGLLEKIIFKNGNTASASALYSKTPFVQNTCIPEDLGCQLTEEGYIDVDHFQKTTVDGIFACGDNTTFMRSVANAVAAGNKVGAVVNKDMINEKFTI